MASTTRSRSPLCSTEWRYESSKTMTLPSSHATVLPPTVIATPLGTSSPRCITQRKFPSPQCGRSCTPGSSRRNCDVMIETPPLRRQSQTKLAVVRNFQSGKTG